MDNGTEVLVAIARLEGKVDQALSTQADHEERIRKVESQPIPDDDTNSRLKRLEDVAKHAVTAKQLWWAFGSTVATMTGALIIFDRIKLAIIGG